MSIHCVGDVGPPARGWFGYCETTPPAIPAHRNAEPRSLLKKRARSPDMSHGRFIVLVAALIGFAATVAVGYVLAP
jgi:hypothetical protein